MASVLAIVWSWISVLLYIAGAAVCYGGLGHQNKQCRDNSSQKDCEKLYRNDWFLILFSFALMTVFFALPLAFGMFKKACYRTMSASMMAIATVLLIMLGMNFSMADNANTRAIVAGAVADAIVGFDMIICATVLHDDAATKGKEDDSRV